MGLGKSGWVNYQQCIFYGDLFLEKEVQFAFNAVKAFVAAVEMESTSMNVLFPGIYAVKKGTGIAKNEGIVVSVFRHPQEELRGLKIPVTGDVVILLNLDLAPIVHDYHEGIHDDKQEDRQKEGQTKEGRSCKKFFHPKTENR